MVLNTDNMTNIVILTCLCPHPAMDILSRAGELVAGLNGHGYFYQGLGFRVKLDFKYIHYGIELYPNLYFN